MSATLISTNPAKNYEILGEVTVSTPEAIAAAAQKARAAQPSWAALGFKGRGEILTRLVEVFRKHRDELALLMCREMGRPIAGAEATVDFNLPYWEWNIANAEKLLAPLVTYEDSKEIAEVVYEPAGVVGIIVPWNFPFSNFTWGASQSLVVGNTVLFKTSEETPLFGQLLDRLFAEAGVPEGVFNQVYGAGDVGAALTAQSLDLLCFTGSTATGRRIYEAAAKQMIPALLEMGGSDPGIVFEDADIARLAPHIFDSRFRNTGQICCALKRLIVHESRMEDTFAALTHLAQATKLGDPEDRATSMGPLVSKKQLELLESQVEDARAKGAKFLTGGKRPAHLQGAFYEPTLVTNVTPDMRIWREEVFGPVLPIVPFKTFDEAIALARDTTYGLGSYVYSENKETIRRAAQAMRCGMVVANGVGNGRPCNPFGGRGCSGLGMENGPLGLREVCRPKLITRPF